MSGNLYPDLVRLLRDGGCEFVRDGKGSHELWKSPLTQKSVRRSKGHPKASHRKRNPQTSWPAEGVLRKV
jgi:hypothetical protein